MTQQVSFEYTNWNIGISDLFMYIEYNHLISNRSNFIMVIVYGNIRATNQPVNLNEIVKSQSTWWLINDDACSA